MPGRNSAHALQPQEGFSDMRCSDTCWYDDYPYPEIPMTRMSTSSLLATARMPSATGSPALVPDRKQVPSICTLHQALVRLEQQHQQSMHDVSTGSIEVLSSMIDRSLATAAFDKMWLLGTTTRIQSWVPVKECITLASCMASL